MNYQYQPTNFILGSYGNRCGELQKTIINFLRSNMIVSFYNFYPTSKYMNKIYFYATVECGADHNYTKVQTLLKYSGNLILKSASSCYDLKTPFGNSFSSEIKFILTAEYLQFCQKFIFTIAHLNNYENSIYTNRYYFNTC